MSRKITKTKKLAVVVSGWHYPYHFYEAVAGQKLPDDWSMDLFCVSHRDPQFAVTEKAAKQFDDSLRGKLDQKLYPSIITVEQMQKLGWQYKEYPNTIGDWGCSNQWLDEHNFEDYDLLLFSHDDNLILVDTWFSDIITDQAFKDWEILANSAGMPQGWIRGSCEFFKPSFLKKLGGQFDLSRVTLTREGETSGTENIADINDWNNTVHPLMEFIDKHQIAVGYLSPSYRVSLFVIEGERGYIANTHGINTAIEDQGLEYIKQYGLI